MFGTLYNVFDTPLTAIVVCDRARDESIPEGSVRVVAWTLLGVMIMAPQVVPLVDAPPGDGAPGFVIAR